MCSKLARMPAKYYIYAGGRWCEVDTRRGRVSGWRQRARFCFLRGGRLEVARAAGVLRALRALASGVGGAARDAAPLQRRRPHRPRRESVRAHHCCSQHLHHSRCDLNANELNQKPPLTLPASTPITAVTSPRKRKRSTSEEAARQSKQPKSQSDTNTAKQGNASPQKSKINVKVRGKEAEKIVESLLESSSSDERKKKQSQQKSKTSPKIRSKEEEELVQSLLQSSSEDSSRNKQKTQSQKPKGKGNVKKLVQTVLPSSQEAPNRSRQRAKEKVVQALINSPSTTGKSPQKNVRNRGKEEQKIVQSLLQSSSSEDSADERPKPRGQQRSKAKDSDKSDSSSDSSIEDKRIGQCKELVIGDEDVAILRKFLEGLADGTDLERFDKDEEYKTSMFFKLNPLVVLSRCRPLERLLLQRLTLKEFARQLGLRSVADVTPEKRYRMRHSTRQARHVTSDSEHEKENVVIPKRRQLWNRDKELFNSRSSRSSDIRERPQIQKPARDASSANDSDAEIKRHIKRHLARRTSTRANPDKEDKATNKKANDDNESVVISDVDSETEAKKNIKRNSARRTRTKVDAEKEKKKTTSKKANDDNDSFVISDSASSSDESDNQGKRGNKDNDALVITDTEDKSEKSIRTRARVAKNDENESVIVSDESNSTDGRTFFKKRRTRASVAKNDENESVVVSDDSNTDEGKSVRRTRSQAPEKRVPRERNTSVVMNDDTDGDENRDKTVQKFFLDNNKNTDENKGRNEKTKARGPNRALKEQNRSVNTDKEMKLDIRKADKAKKDVEGSSEARTTRSSMKGTDNEIKESNKIDSSKKDLKSASSKEDKRKDKPGPAKKEVKGSKIAEVAPIMRDQDKMVLSESDSAFDTSKLSQEQQKKLLQQKIAAGKVRNANGRFVKIKDTNEEKKITENNKEKDKKAEIKTNERQRIDIKRDKGKDADKNTAGNENNKGKSDKTSAVIRNMFMKPIKSKKSCVANGREYTSLEDHAIVAWVSLGNRERMVNGNAIWRELQAEYTRLTSQTRSWHSLRNRYLRYILPSLGSLALPPAQVSRLRAAAAVGKIKHRENRRNSIFSAPRVRSAAVAGRARMRIESDEDDKKERTPPAIRRTRLPSSPSPSKRTPSPSKTASSPSKPGPSHSKTALSPSKPGPSHSKTAPSPTKSLRIRARPSATSTPTPQKKKRSHYL